LRDKSIVYVKFRLTNRVRASTLIISLIGISHGLGLGLEKGIWLGLHFQTGMLFQDQQNMLRNDHLGRAMMESKQAKTICIYNKLQLKIIMYTLE